MSLPALAHLKRVSGARSQATGVAHVIALPSLDAQAYRETHCDMRSWRPRYGWAISDATLTWLHIPSNFEIVHRSEAR